MPRSNFCEDYHREFLEKVWLKKNHNITVGGIAFWIFTLIGSHVNEKGKKIIIKN